MSAYAPQFNGGVPDINLAADTDFLHVMQHANVQILQAKYKQTGLISNVLAIIIATLVTGHFISETS